MSESDVTGQPVKHDHDESDDGLTLLSDIGNTITRADCERAVNRLNQLAQEQPWAAVSHQQAASWWRDAATTAPEDDEPDNKCEGHYDDDFTLLSGVGIGEPTYCDGTCRPHA
jgi:predicted flap endonuclease-1-like 5' DNA nuclease